MINTKPKADGVMVALQENKKERLLFCQLDTDHGDDRGGKMTHKR
jgi:hypothetical protein